MWPANGTGSWSGAMLALHRTGRNYILSPTHSYLPCECPAPSFPDCVYWLYLFAKRLSLSLASVLGSIPRVLGAQVTGHNSTIKKLRFKTFKSEVSPQLFLKSHALPDPCFPVSSGLPGLLPFSQPLTWTRVHRNIWNLGARATPAARLLPRFSLGEDLRLGDGVV